MATQESFLVIGGAGTQGELIVGQLLARGETKVSIYDALPLAPEQAARFGHLVQVYVGDITTADNTFEAALVSCRATCIIHCGMVITRGASIRPALFPSAQLKAESDSFRKLHRKVNSDGMQRIFAAILHGSSTVTQLLYISQADMLFDGRNRPMLQEVDAPYPAPIWDEQFEPASLGERMVLSFNGIESLRTAAIRPATVYGPGGYISFLLRSFQSDPSLATCQLGDNDNLVDRTHVANVAHAAILAADRLSPSHPQHKSTAGHAFFISDASPRKMWDFTRDLWAAVSDLPLAPPTVIAKTPVLIVSGVIDMVNKVRGKKTADLKRTRYLCATRTYDISLAQSVLGYAPILSYDEGIRICMTAEWWLKQQRKICQDKRQEEQPPPYDHDYEESAYIAEKSPFF
ncbi:3-beta hydroxysteroid dehydrogenase/isomerase family-domain-containing protein [Mycena amicta]|nr:3-beta hydroxysteroid dehydrogenase/isomerase family-domain-containing protein [Mycena amicta]